MLNRGCAFDGRIAMSEVNQGQRDAVLLAPNPNCHPPSGEPSHPSWKANHIVGSATGIRRGPRSCWGL